MAVPCGCAHRLTLVTGHYGVGKTEFSMNLALALAGAGEAVVLADLDIVNPYFRPRERRDLLDQAGVRLIATSQACMDADVPALPAELLSVLEDRRLRGVLDVGGDPSGARVLARFRPQIAQEDYQLLCVLNANRPEVRAPEDAVRYLRDIEAVTGLVCTGLVNNTHLCGETAPEDVRALTMAAGCGVTLLATAHGAGRADLERRPLYRPLLEEGLFRFLVGIRQKGERRVYTIEELR